MATFTTGETGAWSRCGTRRPLVSTTYFQVKRCFTVRCGRLRRGKR